MHRFFSCFFCFLFILAAFGCKKPEPVVLTMYCSETFWDVMKNETEEFRKIYGVRVKMLPIHPKSEEEPPTQQQETPEENASPKRHSPAPWRNRPKVEIDTLEDKTVSNINNDVDIRIRSIPLKGVVDVYLSDSPVEQDLVRDLMLISHEYPVILLKMGLWVKKGNPLNIQTIKDIIKNKKRIGITDPTQDGMGVAAKKLLDTLTTTENVPKIKLFDHQSDLLRALETDEVDAVLAWDATNIDSYLVRQHYEEYRKRFSEPIQKALDRDNVAQFREAGIELYTALLQEKQFTALIPLKDEEQFALQIQLLSLTTTLHDKHIRRFADFLLSPYGQDLFKRHGFR
jgi:ABC-type molybdate transport system substrate-binding protein